MLVSTMSRSIDDAGPRAASKSPCRRCKPMKRNQSGIAGKRGPFQRSGAEGPSAQLLTPVGCRSSTFAGLNRAKIELKRQFGNGLRVETLNHQARHLTKSSRTNIGHEAVEFFAQPRAFGRQRTRRFQNVG